MTEETMHPKTAGEKSQCIRRHSKGRIPVKRYLFGWKYEGIRRHKKASALIALNSAHSLLDGCFFMGKPSTNHLAKLPVHQAPAGETMDRLALDLARDPDSGWVLAKDLW